MPDVQPDRPPVEPTYLGDGVYALFDGYHVVLRVGDHRSEPVVYLEQSVLSALMDYNRRILDAYK